MGIFKLAKTAAMAVLVTAFASQTPAQAQDQKEVSLLLPWSMLGVYDPLALAKTEGFYAEAGLDVSINQGSGSLVTAQAVANGSADFGYADAATAAQLIAKGAKIKVVGVFQRKSALSVIYHPPLEINSVDDLRGTSVIHGANDAPTQVFSVLLSRNDMTWDDLNSVVVAPSAYAQTFLSTSDGILLGNVYSTYQSILAREPNAKYKYFADFGVNVLSSAVIVSQDMIDNNPDMVRGFLAATVKGFNAAIDDPDAAVEAAVEIFPEVVGPKREINHAELMAGLDLLHTPETEGHGLGWTSESQWTDMLQFLREKGDLTSDLPVDAYYTNEFLPEN